MDYLDDSHQEYDISPQVIRFETESGSYENVITNLPDIEFDFEDFKDLYHMRWGKLYEPSSYTNFFGRNALIIAIPTTESSYKILNPSILVISASSSGQSGPSSGIASVLRFAISRNCSKEGDV